MRIMPLISWRAIPADDVITHFFGGVQISPRVSTGLVVLRDCGDSDPADNASGAGSYVAVRLAAF
jgi:hypothetical protein